MGASAGTEVTWESTVRNSTESYQETNNKIHILLTRHSERSDYHRTINVFIFLDPSKMYPDAKVLDCRIKGGGMGLMSQLLSVLNRVPTVVGPYWCAKELLQPLN